MDPVAGLQIPTSATLGGADIALEVAAMRADTRGPPETVRLRKLHSESRSLLIQPAPPKTVVPHGLQGLYMDAIAVGDKYATQRISSNPSCPNQAARLQPYRRRNYIMFASVPKESHRSQRSAAGSFRSLRRCLPTRAANSSSAEVRPYPMKVQHPRPASS